MTGRKDRRVRPDHEFRIIWSRDQVRFDICRDGIPTGAHAKTKESAVATAIREASTEANSTGRFVVVTSTLDGRRVLEWDGYDERWQARWVAKQQA